MSPFVKTLPGPLKAAYGYSRSRKITEGKQLTGAIVVSTCIGDHSSAKRGRDAAAKHSVQITGTGETKPPLYCDTVPISNHPNRADVFSIRNLGVFKNLQVFLRNSINDKEKILGASEWKLKHFFKYLQKIPIKTSGYEPFILGLKNPCLY